MLQQLSALPAQQSCHGLLNRGAQAAAACATPGCGAVHAEGQAFKRCAKCMFVTYCGKARA